jgi:hypothetical protein
MTNANAATSVASSSVAINRLQIGALLERQRGKFVAIDFVKLDGSNRKIVGRFGVEKHSQGGENKVATPDRTYLTIYDVIAKGYRTVNLETVAKIRAGNCAYHVVN